MADKQRGLGREKVYRAMSVDGVTSSLLQSQLAAAQLRQAIGMRLARKALDVAQAQGDAVLALLDGAAQLAAQGAQNTGRPALTLGALASGLGQNLDVCA